MEIRIPTSGGKAGKGHNKTSTVQVMDGNMLVKQFRFKVGDSESYRKAREKAKLFINHN